MNTRSTDILIDYIHQRVLNGRNEITVTSQDDLLTSGIVDSIGIMQLIAFVEKEFDVKVPPEDMTLENFLSIEAIVNYIERRKGV